MHHLLQFNFGYGGYNAPGLYLSSPGSYFITDSFTGTAVFGLDTITSISPSDLFIARLSDSGDCLGFDHVGSGQGLSVVADGSGVYMTGVFSNFPSDTGSIRIGNDYFTTYGFEDIVFAKHDLMTGIEKGRTAGDNNLVIYANPNKGSFRVKLPDEFLHENNLSLTVYDSQGKIIKSRNISLNQDYPRLDIFGQSPGVYFVTVSNGKKSYSGKMVVE